VQSRHRKLEGRTAVISGSGRNLGLATAELLAEDGCSLVLNARTNASQLNAAVARLRSMGAEAIGVLADLGTREGCAQLAEAALAKFGRVEILINNVSIRPTVPFLEMTYEQWREVIALTLESAMLLSQAFVPGMIEARWGRIVNISGLDAFWGKAEKAHLVSANLGLVGLARSLSSEFATDGITVNAVVPGGFETTRDLKWYPEFERRKKMMEGRISMKRFGRPEELAEVTRFLVSPAASYVTGQTIHVNGGAFPTTRDPYLD
jgi:NAD(P)-dependent dehydrogenase (short-subunit alcohol dehydrogenase family)